MYGGMQRTVAAVPLLCCMLSWALAVFWVFCWGGFGAGGVVFLRVPQVGYVSQPDGPRRLLSFVYMDRQGPMPLLPAVVHLENPRATYVLTSGHVIRFLGARVTTLATAVVYFCVGEKDREILVTLFILFSPDVVLI